MLLTRSLPKGRGSRLNSFYATYPVFAKREGLATVQLLPAVEHRLLPGEDARGVSIHHGLHNLSEIYNHL